MQGDGLTHSTNFSCATEPPSSSATSLTGDPQPCPAWQNTHYHRRHLHFETNMTYGEQVVNKGFLLLKEKDPHP